jgi:hypothetical protein
VLRDTLLRRVGDTCAITGSCPRELLESAHFVPFPSGNVNSPDNAMLLRSDLHTLWDLNLIGIEPTTRCIHIAPRLLETIYEKLAGHSLGLPRQPSAPLLEGLRERWRMFQAAHPSAVRKPRSDEPAGESSAEASAEAEVREESTPERLRPNIETESIAISRFTSQEPAETGN